jgi:hypothetical protein
LCARRIWLKLWRVLACFGAKGAGNDREKGFTARSYFIYLVVTSVWGAEFDDGGCRRVLGEIRSTHPCRPSGVGKDGARWMLGKSTSENPDASRNSGQAVDARVCVEGEIADTADPSTALRSARDDKPIYLEPLEEWRLDSLPMAVAKSLDRRGRWRGGFVWWVGVGRGGGR